MLSAAGLYHAGVQFSGVVTSSSSVRRLDSWPDANLSLVVCCVASASGNLCSGAGNDNVDTSLPLVSTMGTVIAIMPSKNSPLSVD